MHPRTLLRNELSEAVSAALPGVQLHVSRARALKSGEQKAVLVYVTSEQLDRKSANLVKRGMSAEVVVMCSGADGTVADDLDDMCRRIELELCKIPEIELTSAKVEFDGAGQTVVAVCVMTLAASKLDNL